MEIFVLFIVIVGFACLALLSWKKRNENFEYLPLDTPAPVWQFANVFQRRAYLFDSATEYNLFKILNELYDDRYYIFPQVNLSHLIEPKDKSFYNHRANRSRIEKKSVDFVLCDKIRVVPQFVIELDGYTHQWESRKERDLFVNQLMKDVRLPILRMGTQNLSKDFIKAKVEQVLSVGS